ncbi:MAG TPA: phenylalanine--tRNA ligase subunit alpha [Candidatus Pacearchaeota archaeon]|nr:phenylalanine--tRNA ligase subunit alpha [Candidatus Pacearchaeota archaeon]
MDTKKIIESLSLNEVKILPYIEEENIEAICEKTDLEKVSVLRALEYLKNKKILTLSSKKIEVVEIGVNGALYRKKGLPERRFMDVLKEKRILGIKEMQKLALLSDEELKASIGILKKKSIIELKNQKIFLDANEEEISKKIPEEIFIESLPVNYESLSKEQEEVFKSLIKRKDIVRVKEEKSINIQITKFGKEIVGLGAKSDLIEKLTPEILKKEYLWKNKKFRRYDILASVPEIYGGKRHFVNHASDYARKIWTDMGFKEMTGNLIVSSFWNFDALFTPQDHPVREMQDTFFINKKTKLPNKQIVKAVKESHEGKLKGIKSKGWGYLWDEEEAKKYVLRTHTTILSAQTLSKLFQEASAKGAKNKNLHLPKKFFALGKCFRNETLDWSHGFEFNQTEGIVIDKNANFRHLLGYLKQFFKKMGFEKIRFRPAYFPYTEPSVEIDAYHERKKIWLELGGAGIFRPEVVVPLLGENIPVIAWGPGFDRIIMDYYEIKDLRELYKNNIAQLRKIKSWLKT